MVQRRPNRKKIERNSVFLCFHQLVLQIQPTVYCTKCCYSYTCLQHLAAPENGNVGWLTDFPWSSVLLMWQLNWLHSSVILPLPQLHFFHVVSPSFYLFIIFLIWNLLSVYKTHYDLRCMSEIHQIWTVTYHFTFLWCHCIPCVYLSPLQL